VQGKVVPPQQCPKYEFHPHQIHTVLLVIVACIQWHLRNLLLSQAA
jgi:hypothetical protein